MSSLCWIRIYIFLFLLLWKERATSDISLDFLELWGGAEKEGLQSSGTPGMLKACSLATLVEQLLQSITVSCVCLLPIRT